MARPASIFAKIKSDAQREELVALWKEHANHYTRMRAHAIILSDARYEIQQIVEIFGVNRDSVRDWIKRFHQGGVNALLDDDRPGGPKKLNEDEEEILRDLLVHPGLSWVEIEAATVKIDRCFEVFSISIASDA